MKKIKISFILEDYNKKPFWINKILYKLNQEFYVENFLIYRELTIKKKNIFNSFLFRSIIQIEKFFFHKKFEHKEFIFEPKKIYYIKTKKIKNYFVPQNINKIKKVDCIINLSDKLVTGKITTKSKHGIWGLHHSDNNFQRGGYGGFYEIIEKKKYSGITLQRYNEKIDGGEIIDKVFFKTKKTYLNNHYNLLNKSASFLTKNLYKLEGRGITYKKTNLNNSKIKSHPSFSELIVYIKSLIV